MYFSGNYVIFKYFIEIYKYYIIYNNNLIYYKYFDLINLKFLKKNCNYDCFRFFLKQIIKKKSRMEI